MRFFRFVTVAISTAFIISLGAAQAATTSSPPPASDDFHALDLRTAGSRLVVETIEDALRQGGLALLGENFQLSSSLQWNFGEDVESIEGELDAVIPLLSRNGHIVFTQPGFVFWTGLGEEERVDANLGVVYRTNLANTPVGIDAVAGASLFYDYDFHQAGHERLGIGVDMQTGDFHGAFNYYHPLSNVENGREGYVEEVLRGMDLRVALERNAIRAGASLGYWRHRGGRKIADDWRVSVGVDAGVRILPGVFVEGKWEKHQEDMILDQRLRLGLAFRFSLPGFEGASYGDNGTPANLYRFVDREKRILYEERVTGPGISLARSGSGDIAEDSSVDVEIRLNEPLEEDVTINLIGSGSATYGEMSNNGDWLLNNGSRDCDSVEGSNCQVTIAAGQTSADGVVISIHGDGRTGEGPETIILTMEIASAGDTGLMLENSNLSLTIPADPPAPTVSLTNANTEIAEGGTANLEITLSEQLSEDVVIDIIAGTDGATYGTSSDWHLNNGTNCASATEGNCQITIPAGDRFRFVALRVNADNEAETMPENFTVSVSVASGGTTSLIPLEGSSSLNFTIPAAPTVSLNYGGSTNIAPSSFSRMTIELNRALIGQDVTVNITETGSTATYGMDEQWHVDYSVVSAGERPGRVFPTEHTLCTAVTTATDCAITIQAGQTVVDFQVTVAGFQTGETANVTLGIASGSSDHVTLGTPTSYTLTAQ